MSSRTGLVPVAASASRMGSVEKLERERSLNSLAGKVSGISCGMIGGLIIKMAVGPVGWAAVGIYTVTVLTFFCFFPKTDSDLTEQIAKERRAAENVLNV